MLNNDDLRKIYEDVIKPELPTDIERNLAASAPPIEHLQAIQRHVKKKRRASAARKQKQIVSSQGEQPRDKQGRFASFKAGIKRLVTPKPKKPVQQRGFVGRVQAVLSGDYARWQRSNARSNAKKQGLPLERKPKKRKRR